MFKIPNRYLLALEYETAHRKKWLKKAVQNKRYIRGKLNAVLKDRIHSRYSGQTTFDPAIRSAVLRKTGGKCYLCWRQWTENKKLSDLLPRLYFTNLQVDHVVPFSKHGPNSLSNYMPICSNCNNKKSDLSLAEYRAGVRRPRWRKS